MVRDQERRFRMNVERLEGRSLTTALAVVSPASIQSPEGGHATADVSLYEHPNASNTIAALNYHHHTGFFGS
jgi:hypothetical protein